MTKKVLVTGSSGLIGTAVCQKFAQKDWDVYGVDKYLRSHFLQSNEAETKGQIQELIKRYSNIIQYNYDINDIEKMSKFIKDVDAVVHCAAQVSHPRSLQIPIEDARTNIMGTLNLLELIRKLNSDIPFAFLSSNKVYGANPNYFNYKIIDDGIYRRYENCDCDAFDESLPINYCSHTPFGISKVAADFYNQDYANNYGMKTATFRGGCLIGKNQCAAESQGFLGFFTKQVLLKKMIKIYGGGYRVRDNIHASDVADIIYIWINSPKPNSNGKYGIPYNLGGMRQNSVSIFETLDAIQAKTGIKSLYEDAPERKGDHLWWISDMSRFKRDYPNWHNITKDLDYIFNELIEHWIEIYNLDVDLSERDYFKKLRKDSIY